MLSRGEVNVFGDCEALNVVWDGDEALVELKKHSNGCGRCEVQQEKMRWKRCCFWILATWKISGELNFIMFVVSNGRRFDWFNSKRRNSNEFPLLLLQIPCKRIDQCYSWFLLEDYAFCQVLMGVWSSRGSRFQKKLGGTRSSRWNCVYNNKYSNLAVPDGLRDWKLSAIIEILDYKF
jgi:hypothetical protein